MRVADIMTSPVTGIVPTASIAEAAQVMVDLKVSGLPVISVDKRLIGIITESDFLHRVELGTQPKRSRWLDLVRGTGREAEDYVQAAGRRVEDIMTRKVLSIAPDASLDELVRLMQANRIKRVPVVGNGKLVGIVSRADLMRAMLRLLPGTDAAARNDEAIRSAVVAELAGQHWIGSSSIRVRVHQGQVELVGVVSHDSQRKAARVAAENVPGVRDVIDHLTEADPVAGVQILRDTDIDGSGQDPQA